MVFLTHETELNRTTGRCALERSGRCLKTCDFGSGFHLLAEGLVGTSERYLPVFGIARKRVKQIVQAGVSCTYSTFLHGHSFGASPTPCGSSFFCFGLRRLWLRFPSATDPP
jgi:hypothetical protein